jgi:hypothetical protein
VRNHVGLYAAGDASINAMRPVRNDPRVRTQRRRNRTELDDPPIAAEIVVDSEVEIRISGDAVEDHGIANLVACASDKGIDFLRADPAQARDHRFL